MFNSTRLALITGNPERLAAILISTPKVIGPRRAQALFDFATSLDPATKQTRSMGRRALQQCAKAANRHRVAHNDGTITQTDRVFSKASTLRLKFWAQGKNTPV
jgi:hypothetical protein